MLVLLNYAYASTVYQSLNGAHFFAFRRRVVEELEFRYSFEWLAGLCQIFYVSSLSISVCWAELDCALVNYDPIEISSSTSYR